MQIFKRITSNSKRLAQNLIEFVFIAVIIIFLTLGIFEVSLFWQEVNAIYSLNEEIAANVALVDTSPLTMHTICPAATRAVEILKLKDAIVTSHNDPPDYTEDTDGEDGEDPFKLYKYVSTNTVTYEGNQEPQVTMWVDCRNPYEDGIITQLEFYHKLVVMGASIPSFTSPEPIEIIPNSIFIASPKVNTVRHY